MTISTSVLAEQLRSALQAQLPKGCICSTFTGYKRLDVVVFLTEREHVFYITLDGVDQFEFAQLAAHDTHHTGKCKYDGVILLKERMNFVHIINDVIGGLYAY